MSVSNVDDAMISFTDINLVSIHPPCRILNNVTGYVVKGGITALMGASGSGKTLLMRALCGRSYGVNVTGSVSLKGTIINPVKPNNIGFVPQEDILIGELTVRETFRISARLRLPESDDVIESEINELIKGLGLEHVADNVIGTILKRGLSGGEKRRVSAGVELAARPSVIFLDEPTSGLDASSAFVVIKSIKQLAKNSGGRLCVMASMHQPNSRLLYLFDHLLMLGRGGMVYFGSVSHSVDYFTSLGFPCPSRTTPTDFFLHLIDQRFGSASDTIAVTNQAIASIHTDSVANMTHYNIPVKPQPSTSSPDIINNKYDGSSPAIELQPILQLQQQPPKQAYTTPDISLEQEARNFDFGIMYQMSDIAARARHIINVGESREMNWVDGDGPVYKTSWFRQLTVLTHRNWMVAQRDLTLYWLQFVLNTFYGFMVGAEFFQLPTDIGARLQDYTNGIVWLVFVGTYLHVFKVYYLMVMKERYHHEHANQSYATSAWSLADLLVTSVWTFTMFIPGLLIAYFMMGLPSAAVGYVIFVLFLVAMTAESLMDLLCQFSSYIPTSILIGQGSLVVWCVFAGGAFIRWQKIGFWIWLSETSLYTWSTRGIMIRVFKHITYSCMPESIQSNRQCAFNGLNYPCDAFYDSANSVCQVRGSTVLYVYKGVSSSNEWFEAGILIVLLASFRILTYILLRYPWARIRTNVVYFIHRSGLSAHILQQEVQISSLAARLQVLERQVRFSQQPSIQIPRQPILGPGLNIQCVQQEMNTLVNDDQRVTFHESRSSTSLDRSTITSAEFHQADIKTAPKSRSFRWNSSTCSLTWQRLRLELAGSGKMLVDDLYGQAQPGRVLAIMGPSGAGKTTMLNALSGRAPYAKVMGTVLIGSEPLSKDHLDYVPQFDVLNPAMTVKQSFCIMAKLKNTDVECDKRVAELLIILGLLSHGDSQIQQLSSGDRKRVSIGLALISNPAVLFLDEPTTGLDSEAALVVVEYLIKVTRSTGVICCMTIHQPSAQIFNQLDDLLLLTGGQTAYFGEASKAGDYFTSIGFPVPNNTNPSDFYLDLVYAKSMDQISTLIRSSTNNDDDENQERMSVAVIDERKQPVDGLSDGADPNKVPDWKQNYLSSQYSLNTEALAHHVSTSSPPAQSHRPSEWQRLMVLVPSKMVYYWRERAIYLYRLIQLILLAIFIGTLFYRQSLSVSNLNEIAGAMFFSVWVVLFAAIGATPVLVRDRFCFDNEYLNGAYQISTYCLAIFVAALPYHIVTAVVYQTIVWYLVGFNDNAEAWIFSVLSTLALLLLMEGVSMVVVEFLPNAMLSTTFTMVVLGMFFLFPGFFIKVSDMVKSIAWLSWVMPTKYSLDSQLENIFHGQSYRVSGTTTISGDDITSQVFKLDDRPKWADWVIVMGYMLFFRVVHYVVVRAHYAKFAVKIDAGQQLTLRK